MLIYKLYKIGIWYAIYSNSHVLALKYIFEHMKNKIYKYFKQKNDKSTWARKSTPNLNIKTNALYKKIKPMLK